MLLKHTDLEIPETIADSDRRLHLLAPDRYGHRAIVGTCMGRMEHPVFSRYLFVFPDFKDRNYHFPGFFGKDDCQTVFRTGEFHVSIPEKLYFPDF